MLNKPVNEGYLSNSNAMCLFYGINRNLMAFNKTYYL